MKRAAIVLLLAAGLAACDRRPEAPTERGVCYVVTPQKDAPPRFDVLARDQEQLEFCAARLEEMRIRFLRMGGARKRVIGAYQGKFLFVDASGVSLADKLDGPRFAALRRSRDGRLAVPGAFPMKPKAPSEAPAPAEPAAPAQ